MTRHVYSGAIAPGGRLVLALPLALGCLMIAKPAQAQLIDRYFPTSVPGYGTDPYSSVISRQQLLAGPQGIQVGDFVVRPNLSQSFGYDSNTLGIKNSGSTVEETNATLGIASEWARDSIGASFSVDDARYLDKPIASTTNWTAAIGGSLAVGRGSIDLGYTHLGLYLGPTTLGVQGLVAPVPYSDDDVRLDYNASFGRVTLTPGFDYQNVVFGSASGQNAVNYNGLDHQIEGGTLTGRYDLSTGRGVVAIIRGTEAQYTTQTAGVRNDYGDISGFVGLDDSSGALFHYRALIGVETRSFLPGGSARVTTPTAELDLVWTPTLLTTVTTRFSRQIEDPTSPFANNQVTTDGFLQIAHELRREIVLRAFVEVGTSTFNNNGVDTGTVNENGSQFQTSLGASVDWKINRHVQASLSYSFSNNTYSDRVIDNVNTETGIDYAPNTHVVMLRVSFAE